MTNNPDIENMKNLVNSFQKIGEEFVTSAFNVLFPKDNHNMYDDSNIIKYQRHNDNKYIYIYCELPGFSKNECKLNYDNNRLYIKATHDNKNEHNMGPIKQKSLQNEIYVGEIDKNSIDAELKDGILKIVLKKYLNTDGSIEIK